jgi:hypothetical protein
MREKSRLFSMATLAVFELGMIEPFRKGFLMSFEANMIVS